MPATATFVWENRTEASAGDDAADVLLMATPCSENRSQLIPRRVLFEKLPDQPF